MVFIIASLVLFSILANIWDKMHITMGVLKGETTES